MKAYKKADFPVAEIRRFIEPGPIVLVSSAWRGETNIMTMGWHMVMEFEPSLIGCYIWDQNHSQRSARSRHPLASAASAWLLIEGTSPLGSRGRNTVDR